MGLPQLLRLGYGDILGLGHRSGHHESGFRPILLHSRSKKIVGQPQYTSTCNPWQTLRTGLWGLGYLASADADTDSHSFRARQHSMQYTWIRDI
jgi:hypothetical protein